jgi:hypothetical protein
VTTHTAATCCCTCRGTCALPPRQGRARAQIVAMPVLATRPDCPLRASLAHPIVSADPTPTNSGSGTRSSCCPTAPWSTGSCLHSTAWGGGALRPTGDAVLARTAVGNVVWPDRAHSCDRPPGRSALPIGRRPALGPGQYACMSDYRPRDLTGARSARDSTDVCMGNRLVG